jgi:hypothetical protein
VSDAMYQGSGQATPCSQSQIGRCDHLRGWGMAQVEDASWLSVVIRSGPAKTLVNGTLVARLPRMSPVSGCAVGSTLTGR